MMSTQISRNGNRRRRGAALVLTALLMVTAIGMVAFAIDLGYIVQVRTDLQRTADAAALAAAELFPDFSAATSVAHAVAAENGWSSEVAEGDVDPMTVEYGFWHRSTATFSSPAPSNRRTNAVRVTLRRTEATQNPLRLFFAPVLGRNVADVNVSATAWSDHGVCGPFIGIEWLDVGGGAITDSFDSDESSYNPATARDLGSVCSDGPIKVSGNPIVNGDTIAGEDDVVTMGGDAVVTGYIGNRVSPLRFPPVDASQVAVVNDNDQAAPLPNGDPAIDKHGRFRLNSGDVYDLPPGTYYFDEVTLNGGSTLNFSGPTTIYVTGTFTRAGGSFVNNNTQIAQNLQILSTGGTFDITSDNNFYGVIYAPQSRVTLNGDADLFGAIVGNTLKCLGSGMAHYDEALDLDYLEVPPRTMLVD
ncbi:MAG: hypothetical protein HQ582_29195 [Planctomycetes bacterium]|nr:hypothetical protein [Planctomycetota bacterium]